MNNIQSNLARNESQQNTYFKITTLYYKLNIMNEYLLGKNKFLFPICWKIFILAFPIILVMELVNVTKIMITWHTREK